MDHPSSMQSPLLDEPDEPLTPRRSPSRLEFCVGAPEVPGNSPMQRMDWSNTPFQDDCPYTFVEENTFVVDIAPPAPSRLLIVEVSEEDPHAHENTDVPALFFAPSDPEPMEEVVIEPQAPTPVRPPSLQMQADVQESMLPSRVAPPRLNYPHHGFSRSALLQQKTLWNSRHEEWVEWQSHLEQGETQKQQPSTDDAYAGLASHRQCVVLTPPPYTRTPPSGLERDLGSKPLRRRDQDVNASIYPRVGDISALRDPYAVKIDRSFFRLPLWTLHKTLYTFDMQHRSAPLTPFASTFPASTSSSTLSSYSSSTFGEDEESDSTLVADDSPVPKYQLPLEPLRSASSPQSLPSWNGCGRWELSWYARWELLIDIFQCHPVRYDMFDCPVELAGPVEATVTPSSPPGQIFRFTIGEDEDDNDDDEEEDYGTPLADSSFTMDFNEECERALAFYNRELKSPQVTL